jgi:hypothetical protein
MIERKLWTPERLERLELELARSGGQWQSVRRVAAGVCAEFLESEAQRARQSEGPS